MLYPTRYALPLTLVGRPSILVVSHLNKNPLTLLLDHRRRNRSHLFPESTTYCSHRSVYRLHRRHHYCPSLFDSFANDGSHSNLYRSCRTHHTSTSLWVKAPLLKEDYEEGCAYYCTS